MLEVRYNIESKEVSGWCGDESQFGYLDRGRDKEVVLILDIPLPEKSSEAYLFNEATQTLIDNPAYIEPEPPRDPLAEIDEINAKLKEKGIL